MTDSTNRAEKDSPSTETRRKILKGTAVGGGILVAKEWSRPVIESLVVPAHAVTTGGGTDSIDGSGQASGDTEGTGTPDPD